MADITIDGAAVNELHGVAPARGLVWTSPSVGYIFYIDNGSDFVYKKTTDSGQTWDTTPTDIRSGAVLRYAIWFDKWTNGDSGELIHIFFVDTADDDITYVTLDTSDDTLSSDTVVNSGVGVSADTTYGRVYGDLAAVKARGGNMYVGGWIDNDGEHFFYKSTSAPYSSWSSIADPCEGNQVDRIIACCGGETDSNDFLLFYADVSALEVTVKTYDQSGDSWSESSKIGDLSAFNVSMWDAVDRHSDNHVILVHHETSGASLTPDPPIKCVDVTNGTTWTTKTDVFASDFIYGMVGVLINQQNDDIYVAYSDNQSLGDIYYKKSDDGGSTWGTATQLSVTADDHRHIWGGTSVDDNGGRFMPCWFNDDLNDVVTNYDNSVAIAAATGGTNMQINISDSWKSISGMQLQVADSWRQVSSAKINIGDAWKTIY